MFHKRTRFGWLTLLVLTAFVTACGEEGAPESPATQIEEPVLHTDPAGPIEITMTPLDTSGADSRIGALQFVSGYVLTSDHDTFGGLSGLVITSDDEMLALEDVGLLVGAELVFDADSDKLIGLGNTYIHALTDADGAPLNPPPYDSSDAERCPSATADVYETRDTIGQHDSEGIDVGPDLDLYVTFERHHRVIRYGQNGAENIPLPEDLLHAPCNAGLEAIAILPSGDLLLIGEGIHNADRSLRAWKVSADSTTELSYPYVEGFRPTGLAALPNGDALVVERFFTPAIGNKARILKVSAESIAAAGMLDAQEIAFFDGQNFPIDNLDGIAVRSTSGGETDVFLVSDHNFSPDRQRTLLLQFRIINEM